MNAALENTLIDCPGSTRSIVFGLQWYALVGSGIAGKARRRARQKRATHYVIVQAQGAMVGCGSLVLKNRPPVALYAAAQLFARAYPDENASSLVVLPDGRAWVVASMMGAVLAQTDKLYANIELATPEWRDLLAQRPMLREHDGQAVLDKLMTGIDEHAALVKLMSRWASVPVPLRICALALSLTFVVPPITHWIRQYAKPQKIETPVLDAARAWREARHAQLRRTPVHDISQLLRAFTSLHQLPLQLRGWVLRAARCVPQASQWYCTADYLRVHPMASNKSFVQSLPADWMLNFQPLDGVQATWHVPLLASSLAEVSPLPKTEVNTVLVSSLQRALPIFAGITLSEPVKMELTAPVGPQGEPIEPVEIIPLTFRRDVVLTGPLRSFGLLGEVAMVAAWSELYLSVNPGRKPTKSQSVLDVQLKGVIYEHAS